MRTYIIGNDGITLCHEAPAKVNEGEIAVASNAELLAAPLSGKRLLPVERSAWCRETAEDWRPQGADRSAVVGDRGLTGAGAAIRGEAPVEARRSDCDAAATRGATIDEVASATGWQRHTVRGVFSGTLKKKLGLTLASGQEERGRVYRITKPAST
jgi:hypothetical protein